MIPNDDEERDGETEEPDAENPVAEEGEPEADPLAPRPAGDLPPAIQQELEEVLAAGEALIEEDDAGVPRGKAQQLPVQKIEEELSPEDLYDEGEI